MSGGPADSLVAAAEHQLRRVPFKREKLGLHGCVHTYYIRIYLSICPFVYLFVYLVVCFSICIALSFYLSVCLSFCLSVCLSVFLSICQSIYLSIYLSNMRLCTPARQALMAMERDTCPNLILWSSRIPSIFSAPSFSRAGPGPGCVYAIRR